MSLLSNLATFAKTNGKRLLNYAKALIIQAANSPAMVGATGAEKHTNVVEELKRVFSKEVAKFGAAAHNAVSIMVHDAFAGIKAKTPDLLDPLVDAAEQAAQDAASTVISDAKARLMAAPFNLSEVPAPLGVGEFSGAPLTSAPKPPAPTQILPRTALTPLAPTGPAGGVASPQG